MRRNIEDLKRLINLDYKRHVKRFAQLSPSKDIVFLGDSMMAYFPIKAFNLEERIHNLGIPGDTTSGVLNRMETVIRLKPKIVVLHIGLNDIVLTNIKKEESLKNILEIRHLILEHCPYSKVYIVSLTPLNQKDFKNEVYVVNREQNDSIIFNQMIEKVIEEEHYINMYDKLIDHDGILDLSLTTDGIHLNQKGYQIYLNALKDKIEEI